MFMGFGCMQEGVVKWTEHGHLRQAGLGSSFSSTIF